MKKKFTDIKTGVIGVGSMGQHHARVYSEISNLVAIADTDESRGSEISSRFGVNFFSNYREMLSEVDAVTVAAPTSLHLSICEDVAKAGVNLLVEKPLAGNYKDADQLVSISKKYGVILSVGHIERHNNIVQEAKKQIQNGDWGTISIISARRFSPYPKRINDVGVLFDLTIHDVDVICDLADSPVNSVYASGGNSISKNNEDHVVLVMNFHNGIIGICETNWLSPSKVRELDFFSNKIHANLNYTKQQINIDYKSSGEENALKIISLEKTEPLANELSDFLNAISCNSTPLVSGADGLNAVKIVEAGIKSLNTQKLIHV